MLSLDGRLGQRLLGSENKAAEVEGRSGGCSPLLSRQEGSSETLRPTLT